MPVNDFCYNFLIENFEKFLQILNCVFDAPIKKLSKKEKFLTDKPWIDNH